MDRQRDDQGCEGDGADHGARLYGRITKGKPPPKQGPCRAVLIGDIADASKHRFLTRRLPRLITSSSSVFSEDDGALTVGQDGPDFADILRAALSFFDGLVPL